MKGAGIPPDDDDGSSNQSALDELLAFVDNLEALSPGPLSSSPQASASAIPDSAVDMRELHVDDEDFGLEEFAVRVDTDPGWGEERPVDELAAEWTPPTSPPPPVSVPSSSSRSLTDSTEMTTEAPPPTKRRRRQKEELDYLRAHVQELEDELQHLRGRAKAARVPLSSQQCQEDDDAESGVVTINPRLGPSPGEWKARARQEKMAVQRSLIENIKLRTLLEGQLSIARAFEKALQRRDLTATEAAPYLGDSQSSVYVDLDTEEKIFETLGRGLDALHAQVDSVVSAWSPPMPRTMGKITNRTDIRADTQGMYLEFREHRMVPYPVHAFCEILWDALRGGQLQLESGVCITMDHTEDMASLKLVDTFRLSKSSPKETLMTMRIVVKRFIEASRVVCVGESLVETVGHVNLRQREDVWAVFQSVPGELDEACEAAACVRVRPEMVTSDADDGTDIGLLTNLVLSAYKRNFGIMAAIADNALMHGRFGQ